MKAGASMPEQTRVDELRKWNLEQIEEMLAQLKAAICSLTIFHNFEDDATAQQFFEELQDIETRVRRLCEVIG